VEETERVRWLGPSGGRDGAAQYRAGALLAVSEVFGIRTEDLGQPCTAQQMAILAP
jgi:hypothetical protein